MTAATVTRLIDLARADGVEVVAVGDKVRLRGPAESVERWTPVLREHKPAIAVLLNATIPDDLEHLVRRAGVYYSYSADDWQLIRQVAQLDPEGLRRALLDDPLAPHMSNTIGGVHRD